MASIVIRSTLLLATLLLIPAIFGDFTAYQVGLYLIYGLAAQSIGFIWGRTGILPLGQTLFFGLSAYATAHVLRNIDTLSIQILYVLLSIFIASIVAFIIAFMVFRGKNDSGPYFSLITLALVMIAEQLANTTPTLTGGFNGLGGFSAIAGLDIYSQYYYLIVAVVVLISALLFWVDKLPIGLLAKAVADNEPRLQLLGFPTHVIKGLAFGFSAAIAALAGSLFASHQEIVTPTSTGFLLSAQMVIWTAVGGRFHVLGPLLGAVLIGVLSAELRESFVYWEVAIAVLFIVVILKTPGGLADIVSKPFARTGWGGRKRTLENPAPALRRTVESRALSFDNTHLKIGVVDILNGVKFITPEQGIVCVIGPNGAGKTTLLNIITGNLKSTTGQVRLGNHRIDNRAPYQGVSSGIGRKLQVPSVFSSMTVAENLALAMLSGRAKTSDYFKQSALSWCSPFLAHLIAHQQLPLAGEMNKSVSELPQGHRQFLEFAMSAAAEPTLLLLDEPCAGLSPQETHLMSELVQEFQQTTQGLVIIIEHDMSIVEKVADKVLVLNHGQVLAFDDYAGIKKNPDVLAVYSGGSK